MNRKTGSNIIFHLLMLFLCIVPAQDSVFCLWGADTEEATIEQRHRQAIQLGREGKYEQSLTLLRRLMEEAPERQTLNYDYLVVLSWAGRDAEVLTYFETFKDRSVLPVYVLAAAAGCARRGGQLALSKQLYQACLVKEPRHFQARLGRALVTAELGKPAEAFKQLTLLAEEKPMDANFLSSYAYVARLNKAPYTEMACMLRILDLDPGNRAAKIALVQLASSLGAPNVALEIVEQGPNLKLPVEIYEKIKGDHAAQVVQWGDLTPETEEKRYIEIDQAENMFNQTIDRVGSDPSIPRRFLNRAHFDSFFALSARARMKELEARYRDLLGKDVKFPSYVLRLAADAYLFLLKPKKARDLYIEALKQWPHNFPAQLSLFYGYLESESYRKSGRHIRKTAEKQPIWLHVPGSNVKGENSRRLAADINAILFHAYARRLRKAHKMMADKLYIAPANRDVRTQLAKILLWRGWIRRAIKNFRLVLVQDPENLEARVWYRQALIQYHKYRQAQDGIRDLLKLYPEKRPVQKLKRDFDTQHMWYLHSEILSQRGEGIVVGNRDLTTDTWLFTPPMGERSRFFLHHYSHYGRFGRRSVQDDWFGMGLDYAYGDLSGQVEVLQRMSGDGDDYGYRLLGDWSMNDYWAFSAEYTHNGLDVPLKGRIVDLKGNRTRFNLTWRHSDLSYLSGAVTFYDYNDGNRRQAYLLSAYRQLHAGPYLWLTAELEFYASRGTMTGRYYFNPASDASYLFTLDCWQILYRKYDFKFVHRVVASYGTYWQKHYEPGWQGVIRYEHHWDLDDRRAFLYGISYYRRVYDGRPESGYYFYATINWRF